MVMGWVVIAIFLGSAGSIALWSSIGLMALAVAPIFASLGVALTLGVVEGFSWHKRKLKGRQINLESNTSFGSL